MKKYFLLLTILMVSVSCHIATTKYSYSYEMGKFMDLSKGKWILNKPYTNYNKHVIYDTSYNEFKEFLGDSLYEISFLRNEILISERYPYEPSISELRELKLITNCDFLINVKSNIIKDEAGSISHNRGNEFEVESNQGYNEIRIYNLNSLILISEISVIVKTGNIKDPDDNNFTVMNTSEGILVKGLRKLIRKYKKHSL